MDILKNLHIYALSAGLAIIAAVSVSSCSDMVYDDLPECASGAELRFIYDYHMERGNSFMYAVDCLTVYIYDNDGNYVATRTETSPVLADEEWRMKLDLPAGTYHILAYGGMECDKASFRHPAGSIPAAGTQYTTVNTEVMAAGLATQPDAPLHDHFWGTAEITVSGTALVYDRATVEMRKNTNNIRVILQHLDGSPVDPDKFKFEIHADNTLMAHDNSLIDNGTAIYHSWAKGTTDMGMFPDGTSLTNAYAQLSTGRLVASEKGQPRLIITNTENSTEVLDLDLIWLVRQAQQQNTRAGRDTSDGASMPLQEYLDRESRWAFYFLLDEKDRFYNLHIKVNDWDVRFNNIDDL